MSTNNNDNSNNNNNDNIALARAQAWRLDEESSALYRQEPVGADGTTWAARRAPTRNRAPIAISASPALIHTAIANEARNQKTTLSRQSPHLNANTWRVVLRSPGQHMSETHFNACFAQARNNPTTACKTSDDDTNAQT